jgi:flagellar hook-associated protein 3 FlgL
MRIAQRTIYNNMLDGMQSTLAAYMESNIQGASQKKVNRPSDDPAGTARIMNYRASLELNKQHSYNADTAKGWLNLQDETLQQVSTVIISLKELAEEAATSTMTPENRLQTSYAIRAQFNQLINLANTQFEDQHIFGGQKYLQSAFEEGLAVTTYDPNLQNVQWKTEGGAERSILVRFPQDITIDDTGTPTATAYEWTEDGGATWQSGAMTQQTTPAGTTVNILTAGNAQITIPQPAAGDSVTFTAYDPDVAANPEGFDGSLNGSQLFIRPAAYYTGDDNDPPQVVESFGAMPVANCASTGSFSGDVRIRIDPDPNNPGLTSYGPGDTAYFSYSTDNGHTWTPALTTIAATDPTRFVVPGGFLDVDVNAAGGAIDVGQQFVIRPHRANLGYEVMPGEYINVNGVGKDIFGGLYQTTEMKYSDPPVAAQPVWGGDARNLFEVVGRLVAFTECNNQSGVQQCLEDLTTAQQTVLTAAAKVGGLENRLDITTQVLNYQKLDKEERLSYVEDVDLTELLTRLAQQELAYSTVLKSSAMIMELNLTKFI